jgi:uncharacterized membrane protein
MSERTYFDAVLRPNRSLTPRGFTLLMAALGGFSLAVGAAFIAAGAWPVFGFLGLDVLLIYVAFRVNYRSGQSLETVTVTDEAVEVRRLDHWGRARVWRAPPTWLRVEVEDAHEHHCRIRLRSHGRSCVIGTFLAPAERHDLASALGAALAQQRRAAAP